MTSPPRRGRPLKFGRPTRPISLSLPADVIDWLEGIDPDLSSAVVTLFEKFRERAPHGQSPRAPAELVQLPNKRALILVAPHVFDGLDGVAVIRLSDGRGFLALEAGKGYADLEVAVADKVDTPGVSPAQRRELMHIRKQLRDWRQSGLIFESRSILVVDRQEIGPRARALPPLTPA